MIKALLALAVMLVLPACSYFVSWEDANKNVIGHSIDEIIKLEGEANRVWKREDGMTIYRYDLKKLDPSCVHYWVVNDKKVIVDFYYEGYCRPIG